MRGSNTPLRSLIVLVGIAALAALVPAAALAGPAEECFSAKTAALKAEACSQALDDWKGEGGDAVAARYYMERATALAMQGKSVAAMADAGKAIELDSQNPSLYVKRGWVLMRVSTIDKAVPDLTKAIELNSSDTDKAWAFYLKSVCYYVRGNEKVAAAQLKAAQLLDPSRYDDFLAEKKFHLERKASQANKLHESYELAKQALAAGQLERAAALFIETIASNPKNIDAKSWLGSVYFDQGEYERSIEILREVPEAQRWNYYIAASLLKTGRYEEALVFFRLAEGDGPEKNRGVDHGAQCREQADALTGYLAAKAEGLRAEKASKPLEAVGAYKKAMGYMDTPEIRNLIQIQTDVLANLKKTGQQKTLTLGVLLFLFFGAAASVFVTFRLKKRAAQGKVRKWENFVARILALPPREAFTAYYEYKTDNEEDSPRLARSMMDFIAKSRDFELIKAFSNEFIQEEHNQFIAAATEDFVRQGGFANCFDALGLLNEIPFDRWDARTVYIFVNAHVICDEALFDKSKGDTYSIWAEEIPSEAYFLLARIYYRRGKTEYALKVLEKLPQYNWSDQQWLLYLKCMFAGGGINKIELEKVPDDFKIIVLEELFKVGVFKKVSLHLGELSRQKWRPEYYFYMFFISLKGNFDDSWQLYKSFDEQFPPGKANKVHYMFGLLCEHLGKYNRAIGIYETFVKAGIYYKDMNRRRKLIETKKFSELLPPASEVLRGILPASVFAGR